VYALVQTLVHTHPLCVAECMQSFYVALPHSLYVAECMHKKECDVETHYFAQLVAKDSTFLIFASVCARRDKASRDLHYL